MFSYGENNEIDFTKSTVSQILGKNGHGKSTIAHILEEILFNKNSKGYKKASILNRNIKGKNYFGAVEFNKDGDIYRVSINRINAVQKVILTKNGEDISQHTATATYELVEKLFGRDFKMFSQLIYQNSRSSLQFLTATDTIRKKFLIDLLNLEKYLVEHEKIKNAIKEVTGNLNKCIGELSGIELFVKSSKSKNLIPGELKENIKIPEELLSAYKEKSQLLNDVDIKNAAINKNNQYREMRDSIPVEYLTKNFTKIDTMHIHGELAVLAQSIVFSEKLIDKIKKLGNRCHVCEQNIKEEFKTDLLDDANKALRQEKERQEYLFQVLNTVNDNNKEHDKAQKYIYDFEKFSGLLDNNLESVLHDKEYLTIEVNKLKNQIDTLILANNKILEWNTQVNDHNSKLALIKQQLEEANLSISKLKLSIESLNKVLAHLDTLKKAFSTNGLLAYKLEYSVKELETLTNEYLLELSDGKFQLMYAVTNDKLNIIVKDNGADVEIEALSSGELARVTTATLLAIRKLLTSLSTESINVLFLDEVIDTLDDEGKERLIDVLIRETELNTYIVSHGFTHPLLAKLRVEKVKNISRIIND
jgi:DNA repair exonuclease SbcCD ATPase subunit